MAQTENTAAGFVKEPPLYAAAISVYWYYMLTQQYTNTHTEGGYNLMALHNNSGYSENTQNSFKKHNKPA